MAGSDLDGDEYFVSWHPDLLFHGRNDEPMKFPSIKKTQLDRPLEVDDMIEFIVNYIISDKVGVISHAHLALADQLEDGIHDDECKELARLFSHCIDFNKTGFLPPEVQGTSFKSFLPERYPDFMEKSWKKTYTSDRVLGKLHRISKRIESAVSTIDGEYDKQMQEETNWFMDPRLAIAGYEDYEEVADKLYLLYAECLDALQQRYGIETEEQLVSGCVIKIKGNFSRTDDLFEIERRLRLRLIDINNLVIKKFKEYATNLTTNNCTKTRTKQKMAAACYVTTYRDKKQHLSFPWLFAEYLLKILQQNNDDPPPVPIIRLSKSIDDLNLVKVYRELASRGLNRPRNEQLAKVYFVLISWGMKSKFLPKDHGQEDVLEFAKFGKALDILCQQDRDVKECLEDSANTGKLLLAFLRAITNFDEKNKIDGAQLPRKSVINMKRQILIAHHQLARNPSAECLQVRLEGHLKRVVNIPKEKFSIIRRYYKLLRKRYKDEYHVNVWFRKGRGGHGTMTIKGDAENVENFEDLWHENKVDYRVDVDLTDLLAGLM